MNSGVSYSMFYEILLNLREYFHSYGRIDDSNAKLDEIIKLISISYSLAKRGEKFGLEYVRRVSESETGNIRNIASGLIKVFENEIREPAFHNEDGTNIFGAKPSLNIQPTENEFAEKLVSEIEKIDFIYLLKTHRYSDFDIINECFGHFVRENFRNNKEDAQYMTPYEISEPILDIIFSDMERDGYLEGDALNHFTIMDPTCGVGTLLIESSNHFTRYIEHTIGNQDKKNDIISHFRKHGMIGQDKVNRMVRLSKINALLLGCNISNINNGNSIVGKSFIDHYKHKVDFIFTNPPFGAEYSIGDLNINDYPILNNLQLNINNVASELLMLDKCISLLKNNGYLAIVLPDSVFAAKGLNSLYRDQILKNILVKGVVELPAVTFAQAGTRTNTCILYIQKKQNENGCKMFMAECKDLGYIVKEKMGVPVKIAKGTNQMLDIAKCLTIGRRKEKILSEIPSVTQIEYKDLTENILKPSFYAADRYMTVNSLTCLLAEGYQIMKLSDIAEFVTTSRKGYMVAENIKHISVLHINTDCTINFNEVQKFSPISKGRSCEEGDLIFSKINPRIPRMAVIPSKNYKLVCSNEFEIIRPKGSIDAYTLCFLLRTDHVKIQIQSMTSGTSSSHSRIKREQLSEILIPVPVKKRQIEKLAKMGETLKSAINKIYESETIIDTQLDVLEHVFKAEANF
ncbi:MAG: N-6 DNA methylase [Lachnospiraceae bacterium]|nr:N-6 DNA methylase [Lachnospiraceae bacterium]